MKMAESQETAGTILETFEGVSQAVDAKSAQGNSNFFADVIYAQSKFVYVMDHENYTCKLR